MARDGTPTKNKILEESKALVLEHGYAGTSIDMILERTGITKGAFFYHFKTKADLAISLIDNYIENDKIELDHTLSHTENITDPLERLLAFTQLFIDEFASMEGPNPGCLYGSYSYEPSNFSAEINKKVEQSVVRWRDAIINLLEQTAAKYPPKIKIDLESLADQFIVVMEGAIIVSKVLADADTAANQLIHLKNYLQLVFTPK